MAYCFFRLLLVPPNDVGCIRYRWTNWAHSMGWRDTNTRRWCSSPALPPAGPPTIPPKQIILGWYRKISNTILWHLIVAFVIRIISCIADGLSAIQPDIEGAEPPAEQQAPAATTPHPTEPPQHLEEPIQMTTLESPIEQTLQIIGQIMLLGQMAKR